MSGPNRPDRPFPGLTTPEMLAAGQEFTDREPQWMPTRDQVNTPAEGRAAAQMPLTPLGEPQIDVDVRSVYDVRPIQAFDFNLTVVSAGNSIGGEGETPIIITPIAVPDGYVAVVRRFQHSFKPQLPVVNRADVLMTLRSSGADVPYNVDIPVGGSSQGDLVNCFFIVDEGGSFGARYILDMAGSVADFAVYTHIYGNFIRKTGRAANLEIGNPVRGGNYKNDPDNSPVVWLKRIANRLGYKGSST